MNSITTSFNRNNSNIIKTKNVFFFCAKKFILLLESLNFYQIAYIAKLIDFLSLYRILFPVALEPNLTLSQESLLILLHSNSFVKNESISELKINM